MKQRPERWGKEEDGDVLLLTHAVDSEGRICTYDAMNDPDNCDVFDVLFPTDVDGVGTEGAEIAIEKLTVEWRKRGKPSRYTTHFEYALEEDDDQA